VITGEDSRAPGKGGEVADGSQGYDGDSHQGEGGLGKDDQFLQKAEALEKHWRAD